MLRMDIFPRFSVMVRVVAAAGLLMAGACVPVPRRRQYVDVLSLTPRPQPRHNPPRWKITHYSGTDVVPVSPETVVVADIAALLSLHDLGVEGIAGLLGLGVPIPDKYAEALNNPDFEELGSVWEPDYEAINALEPDLIIVAGRSSRIYADMKEIAPTADLTVWEDFYNKFQEQHRNMGKIFGAGRPG